MSGSALVRPHGLQGIVETFGDIRAYIKADGTVQEAWPRAILATVELPELLPLSWDPSVKVSKIRCHRELQAAFSAVFRAVHEVGLWAELKDYGGCYNFRVQRGASKLSAHAWGIAIDVSTIENPLGAVPKLHVGIIQCFEAAGFYWGGRFSRTDAQHFQFAEGY